MTVPYIIFYYNIPDKINYTFLGLRNNDDFCSITQIKSFYCRGIWSKTFHDFNTLFNGVDNLIYNNSTYF